MTETIKLLSLIFFVASAVFLLLSIFLFFRFKIVTIVNDLSGRTARKAIAQIRDNNLRSGDKPFRSSSVNINRGKLTEPIPDITTRKTDKLEGVSAPLENAETTIFREDGTTELLVSDENTTVLAGTDMAANMEPVQRPRIAVQILNKVVLIHTDEAIE